MTIDTDDVKNKVLAGARVTGKYVARTTPKLVARLIDGFETFKTAVAEEQAKLQKEDKQMSEDFKYDMDMDLATINRRIEHKKTIDPYYDPEYARKRRTKFYNYQRSVSNHEEGK